MGDKMKNVKTKKYGWYERTKKGLYLYIEGKDSKPLYLTNKQIKYIVKKA